VSKGDLPCPPAIAEQARALIAALGRLG
jgi:hypothetical protein